MASRMDLALVSAGNVRDNSGLFSQATPQALLA